MRTLGGGDDGCRAPKPPPLFTSHVPGKREKKMMLV